MTVGRKLLETMRRLVQLDRMVRVRTPHGPQLEYARAVGECIRQTRRGWAYWCPHEN
jgi:hypothetical protein